MLAGIDRSKHDIFCIRCATHYFNNTIDTWILQNIIKIGNELYTFTNIEVAWLVQVQDADFYDLD